MISPIVNYGCEVWGFHKAPDIERVHMKFLKQALQVRQQTTNATIHGEFGRVPLIIIRKVRILRYWFKIIKTPDSIMYKLYNMRDNNGNYTCTRSSNVKKLLDDTGNSYLWNNMSVTNEQIENVIRCIYDQYLQQWFSDLRNLSKLETYVIFKTDFQVEKYLSCVTNSRS